MVEVREIQIFKGVSCAGVPTVGGTSGSTWSSDFSRSRKNGLAEDKIRNGSSSAKLPAATARIGTKNSLHGIRQPDAIWANTKNGVAMASQTTASDKNSHR